MNNTNLFTKKAEYYAIYRPSYAKGFIDEMIIREIIGPGKMVADIGAGTGILTKQLASSGSAVFAVEPNESMLEQFKNYLSKENVVVTKGTAEDTLLPENSFDAVFVGQAFHWFDMTLFKEECKRILKKGKPVILVWNRKSPGEMENARKEIVNSYQHAMDYFHCSWNERVEGIASFFGGVYEQIAFSNNLVETWDKFIGRTLSASHAIESTDPGMKAYIADWKKYFNRYQKNGIITVENETVAFWGKVDNS